MRHCFQRRLSGVWAVLSLCLFLHGCASVSRATTEADRFVDEMKRSFAPDDGQSPARTPGGGAEAGSLGRHFGSCPEIAALKRDWLRKGLELKLAKRRIFPKLNVQFSNQSYIGENSLQIKNITEGGLAFQYKIEDLLYYGTGVGLADWELNRVVLRIRKALQNEIMAMKKRKLKKEYGQEALDLSRQALKISAAGAEIAGLDALNDAGGEKMLKKMEWQTHESMFRQAVERECFNQELCEIEIRESFAGSDGRVLNENLFSSPAADDMERIVKDALADHAGFKLAWSNRIDVREAEAELAAREVELASSSLAWFRYLAISLGYGKYYVFKDNDFARFNLRVSFSFPVLDYGETRSIRETAKQDRDHIRQRILALARKLHAELAGEVRRLRFLEKELELKLADLKKHEGMMEAMRVEFAGESAFELLLQKKMELELAKMRLACREQRFLRDVQELTVHFLLGMVIDPKVEMSIIDETIDFWRKG